MVWEPYYDPSDHIISCVLFVWGTFVTLCVTVTNIYILKW